MLEDKLHQNRQETPGKRKREDEGDYSNQKELLSDQKCKLQCFQSPFKGSRSPGPPPRSQGKENRSPSAARHSPYLHQETILGTQQTVRKDSPDAAEPNALSSYLQTQAGDEECPELPILPASSIGPGEGLPQTPSAARYGAALAALNAPPTSSRRPGGQGAGATPGEAFEEDESQMPDFELPLSHPAFQDTQDFPSPGGEGSFLRGQRLDPQPATHTAGPPKKELKTSDAKENSSPCAGKKHDPAQNPLNPPEDAAEEQLPQETEEEMPEFFGEFPATQGDRDQDPQDNDSADPGSIQQAMETETEMPEYMGQQAIETETEMPETEMPEYMGPYPTQEQTPQARQKASYDSDMEAELDAFLDDEVQPPSDDEADMGLETDGPNTAAGSGYVQDPKAADEPEDDLQGTPQKQQAGRKEAPMHSWLVRSPEAVEPPRRRPVTVDEQRETLRPQAEVPEPLLPSRHVMPPQLLASNIDGLLMPVTSTEGDLVYCNLLEDPGDAGRKRRGRTGALLSGTGGLLSTSIHSLMDQVDQESVLKAIAQSTAQPAPLHQETIGASGATKEELWVDKYTPRSFLDLLSDELINKEVLKWLKSWDHCVFGASKPPPRTLQRGKLKPIVTGPPEQKILLMSGAPGLGKTTLAHIVAKHCGYRPVEINASDDRTGTALQTRITDATHMQPVLGSKLPNCVIIDEIDGAAGGTEGKSAIAALLRLINGTPGGGAEPPNGSPGGFTKKKKKKGTPPLNRPIIAICNDLYAPVLRPLRSVAKIVTFKAPKAAKLVTRLQVITAGEKIAIDRQALTMLAEKTEQDVRACLNTLQFLAKQHARIRLSDVAKLTIGQKDMTKDVFSIWNSLLCGKDLNRSKDKEAEDKMYRVLGDFGDHELVLSGVHHNMLTRNYIDTGMASTCRVFDQIYAADSYLTSIRRSMDFSLLTYLPATMLTIRGIVASPDRSRLQWPKPAMDHPRMLASKQALLHSWLLSVSHKVYSSLRGAFLTQEIIPSLIRVLQQPIRAIPVNLFTEQEKQSMASVVSNLISYGISFDMSAEDNAPPAMLLRPEIHTLCQFEGYPVVQVGMPLAARQLIAQEANSERLRIKAQKEGCGGDEGLSPGMTRDRSQAKDSSRNQARQTTQRPASAGQKLMFSVAERASKAGTESSTKKPQRGNNWLEQLRESKQRRRPGSLQQKQQSSSGGDGKPPLAALYKYKEGFTNAVKRPVHMKDLL